ncbi:MAG: leucine-rich repeat protein [Treponema sp.]|nr:leucine-rich repeat protein [Treponema sp.]
MMNRHIISFEKVAELIASLPIGHHNLIVHDSQHKIPHWKILFDIQKAFGKNRKVTIDLDLSQVETIHEIDSLSLIDCPNLSAITLPHSIKSIGSRAFYRCRGLSKVVFSNTTGWKIQKADRTHEDCDVTNPIQNAELLRDWNSPFLLRHDSDDFTDTSA